MSHEPKPLNRREMLALELVYALHAKHDEMDKLEARMRECGVWQYYKPAMGLLKKVLQTVIGSLPDRNKRHMEAIRTQYMVKIDPKPIIGTATCDHVITTADLKLLCECAMRDKCAFCINDLKEAKKCKLRDIFLDFAPPMETECQYKCEYAMLKMPDDNM